MEYISNLKKGEKGIIDQFDLDQIPLKLQELGCLPGSQVEMIQTTFSKDPVHIRINETHLAIRNNLASKIAIIKTFEK